ncbi:2Fe-2S iron-sulfur cluster-binding protein [Glacieibacterium frigidum]|uniref:2Fe-2S iron-sulfur cluster binding domain-containing protein n=1 Tax=Glacieibacterium frigidum TaxID=2593303 RepID=A0A552U9K6_9SPHN|nr:2Fe-2S iron-sulfur cluster-binding protein [Glacieibacterium frigidum]TRW14903.1 2Fe-2S iron-sulfur cluster binding domain-containing protein [Glacieibacterium frigidum]
MTRVRFISADGGTTVEVEGKPGTRLLDLAQANDQPLEGTCEGAMACSTCHVVIAAADFATLPKASAEEEDMLDFAWGVTRTSRLACQIWLSESLASLEVRMPGGSVDMR